jgi:hypothetical protein
MMISDGNYQPVDEESTGETVNLPGSTSSWIMNPQEEW